MLSLTKDYLSFMENKKNIKKFEKPVLIEIGDAIDIIKNEFRPGTGDSIPAVQNINTDG